MGVLILLATEATNNSGSLEQTFHWIILSIVVAVGLLFLAWLNNGRMLMTRVNELTTQVMTAQRNEIECRGTVESLKGELKAALGRIRALEAHTGTGADVSPIPGVVVAKPDGTIVVFGPSLVPILGWLPDEMYGRNISVLVPPELLIKHELAFKKFIQAGVSADPAKVILTQALTKSRARVAVSINLKSLPAESLLVAEIRQRPREPDSH